MTNDQEKELEALERQAADLQRQLDLAQDLNTQHGNLQAIENALLLLLSASPNLKSLADNYLDQMDTCGLLLPSAAIPAYRDAHQRIHGFMMGVINKRNGQPSSSH